MTPEALIAALPVPVLLIGNDERLIAANPPALELLGTGVAGRHYITALRQPAVLDAVETTLQTGAPQDARFLTSDETGSDLSFDVKSTRIPEGVLVSFADVTHLQAATQMRRDFVANVSHELRTPLTALSGFIETMLRGPARDDAAARERFLGIMEVETHRMNRLVGDLMSLSRVEAQERERPTAPVDICALVGSVVQELTPMAKEAGITLNLRVPPEAITLSGDEDQLRQVFINLIENALKYGRSEDETDGKIDLAILGPSHHPRLRSEAVEIAVRDYGPGIDEAHIPRLTERFYRIDDHRSRESGGTGLGLAIVKHIVSRHRGRLQIASKLGKGTRFSVILPV